MGFSIVNGEQCLEKCDVKKEHPLLRNFSEMFAQFWKYLHYFLFFREKNKCQDLHRTFPLDVVGHENSKAEKWFIL